MEHEHVLQVILHTSARNNTEHMHPGRHMCQRTAALYDAMIITEELPTGTTVRTYA